jgi:hypothetical protein
MKAATISDRQPIVPPASNTSIKVSRIIGQARSFWPPAFWLRL